MSEYIIVTDSSADLTQDLVEELGISVLPLSFTIRGTTLEDHPDKRNMSSREFYQLLRDGEMSTTSAVNMQQYIDLLEPVLSEGKDVLILSFTSGLSNTCQASMMAAEELREKFPERRIEVVDTLCASAGQGMLVWYAGKKRLAGESRFRYGTLRVWGTIGYATGVQGAGLAMELLPGYAMFLLAAAACGLSLLGLLGVELQPPAVKGAEGREEKPRLRALLESPQFFLFLLAAFIFSGCSGVNMNYSPVLLTGMGVSTGIVGTVLSVSTVVEIPLFLFSHKFMDRLSGKVLTAACFVLAIGQFLVYGTAESPGVVMAVIVLLKAVTSTLYMMLTLKMVRCLVPAGLTTTGLAVVGAVNSLAGIVMQNICGWIAGEWGIGTMYLFLAGCCGAGLLLTMFLRVRNTETVFS